MKKLKLLSQKTMDKKRAQLKAVEDYYNERIPEDKFKRILTAVKTGGTTNLTDEEQSDVWRIRTNLNDPLYIGSLCVC